MSGNPRNDKSEVKVTLRGMEQYTYMVAFNNGSYNDSFDTEDKGYFLLVTHITVENGRPIPTPLLTDVRLLVKCDRRSEKNFNLALSQMDCIAEEMVDILEEDRKIMEDIPNFDKIIKGLKDAYYEEEKREKEERDNIPSFEEWKKKHQQRDKKQELKTVEPLEKEEKKLTFEDVAGMKEIKEKLKDVIDQFEHPEKYEYFDIKPIKAMLLYGAPGTGKSYIAEAFANEINGEFKKVTMGEFASKYQGQTQNNIRKLFEDARKSGKLTVLFLDEVDSIASKRGAEENSKEKNASLNELLQQMSSSNNDNIFMICATNYFELLDPAFTRKGRIDYCLEIGLPDYQTRLEILKLKTKKKPLGKNVDLEVIARNMSGQNCGDIDVLANESARLAMKRGKNEIEQQDILDAFEEMICGVASENKKLSEKEKTTVSYHESAHALVGHILGGEKIQKISIIPTTGSTLGYVLNANEEENDKFLSTKQDLLNRITKLVAGRAGEELINGEVTGGCSNDIEKATMIAEMMICRYGMSDTFKLVSINPNEIFTREKIINEVKEILDACYQYALEILTANRDKLDKLANVLIEKEVMTYEDFIEIVDVKYEK